MCRGFCTFSGTITCSLSFRLGGYQDSVSLTAAVSTSAMQRFHTQWKILQSFSLKSEQTGEFTLSRYVIGERELANPCEQQEIFCSYAVCMYNICIPHYVCLHTILLYTCPNLM